MNQKNIETMKTIVCEKCGQIQFVNYLHEFKGKHIYKNCLDALLSDLYNWDNPNLAIKLDIGCDYSDFETIYVPFLENIQSDHIELEDMNVLVAFEELKKIWESEKWGYHGNVKNMELVNICDIYPDLDPEDTCEDSEFWKFIIYSELAIESDLYDRPFDESPNDMKFGSYFARDCMVGQIYSKDFNYSFCESCGRYVCEQNPSNGWHSQGHIDESGYFECNKCYEERTLDQGINDEFDGSSIPGQFYNFDDIEAAGWQLCEDNLLAGHGYSDYKDPEGVIGKIDQLINSGKKVLVNYGAMAIGGMGGYVDIYVKD
jgi:hypothetical protein